MARRINETIRERLSEFPKEVAVLALSAVELSESLPETSVSEQLENTVRRVIRERKGTK